MVRCLWPIAGNAMQFISKELKKASKNRIKRRGVYKPTVKLWTLGIACVGCQICTDDKIALVFTVDFYKLATAYTFSFSVFILTEYTHVSPHTLIYLVFTEWTPAEHTHFLWNKSFSRPILQEWKFWNLVNVFLLFAGRRHREGCRWDTHTHTHIHPHPHPHTKNTHTHTCIQPFVGKVRKIKENWIYLQNYRKSTSTSGSLQRRLSVRAGRNVTFGTNDTYPPW